MATSSALIVGDPTRNLRELDNALQLAGFGVRRAAPDELVTQTYEGPRPDMLLVSAALGLQRVALLSERFAAEGRLPTTVVYHEGDIAALEACVRGGFDYVMPPFAPSLLRTRLSACWERGQLTMAVEEMATAASLHSYERDLSIAHEIQCGFLPDYLPVPHGWEVAARFRPARMVAGDFYDAFELVGGHRLALVVADVCDKGVGAALFMALIRTMLRHTAEQSADWDLPESTGSLAPAASTSVLAPSLSLGAGPLLQAVSGTNSYMARHHQRQGYFCTLFFGILDPFSGSFVYINGGHNPAVLVRADGSHKLLGPTGPAVGMFASSNYLLSEVSLEPGDRIFMYTDGVTESRNAAGDFFGMEKTLQVVTQPPRTADELIEAVDGALRSYASGTEQHDDITMLALRRSPA